MKNILFLIPALFPFVIFAQGIKPQNYISLNIASSSPAGKYAGAKDVNFNGFAAKGYSIAIDWSRFHKNPDFLNFGYGGTISVGSHPLNKTALANKMSADGYNIRFSDSSSWMASCLMFGPVYGIKTGNITTEIKLLGGFFFAKAPDVAVENNEIGLPEPYWKYNNNLFECVGALGYQANASVHYQATKHTQLSMKATFYHAKPEYIIKNNLAGASDGLPNQEYKFTQQTSVFDIGFGIGYAF